MATWPIFALAALSGLAFMVAQWVVADVRRHVYNRNRNCAYAERKVRKNMAWRTETPRSHRKDPLPLPPGFAENLCRQWDKVRDATEEVTRFGEMMVELEDYVDNAFIFDEHGDIIGRHPGIKGFLAANCPHIGYSTAIRYRILAMKAREIARKQGDIAKIHAQCHTVRELVKSFDARLRVEHRHLETPRRRCRHPRKDRTPQPAIFSLREAVRSAKTLDSPRRRRVVDALREIMRELAVS